MNVLKFALSLSLVSVLGTAAFAQDNSRTSLDWSGHYSSGKNMHLTLKDNQTYTLVNNGKTTTGKFTWSRNGDVITLPKNNLSFRVGEHQLTGTRYGTQLNKQSGGSEPVVSGSLYGGKWMLIELNGKPVSAYNKHAKTAYISFTENDMRFGGFGGCNSYGGTFEVTPETGRIKFGQAVSTMKACFADGVEAEPLLMKAIRSADNYTIHNGVLSLNKARMAPLARFQMIVK